MSVLRNQIDLPSNWSPQENEEVKEVLLDKNSAEYLRVVNLLSGVALTNLQRIVRVQNPYLYGRYLLRKADYSKKSLNCERTFLHATGNSKVNSIISDNLDWRFVLRSKFGKGVSFSPDAVYANKECSNSNGNDRAMIICKVLMHLKHNGQQNTAIPMSNYDTTGDTHGKVIVKYYDDEFYPEYIAYYKTPAYVNHRSYSRPYHRRSYNSRFMYDSDDYDFFDICDYDSD